MENIADRRIERNVRTSRRHRRARHTEFKLVPREGEWRRSVSVRNILWQWWQRVHAQLDVALAAGVVFFASFEVFQDVRQLLAQEHTQDRRWRFVTAKTMVVASARNRQTQELWIFVEGVDHRADKEQETRVFHRRAARAQQVFAAVCGQGPVDVLTRAVDPFERLFVQQAFKAMLARDLLQRRHQKLVLVVGHIAGIVVWHNLKLAWRHLGMLHLHRNAHAPERFVRILHKLRNLRADRTEVVVGEFLALWRWRTKKCAATDHQVLALLEEIRLNQEIFLLSAHRWRHTHRHIVTEETQNAQRFAAHKGHRTQKRRLFIEHIAIIGNEDRWNVQRTIAHKCRRGWIPGRVAARFKCIAQTAGWERRCVRFTDDQILPGKLQDRRTVALRRKEAVMFFCRRARQRMEPVCKMRRAFLHSPVLHGRSDNIGDLRIKVRTRLNGRL